MHRNLQTLELNYKFLIILLKKLAVKLTRVCACVTERIKNQRFEKNSEAVKQPKKSTYLMRNQIIDIGGKNRNFKDKIVPNKSLRQNTRNQGTREAGRSAHINAEPCQGEY